MWSFHSWTVTYENAQEYRQILWRTVNIIVAIMSKIALLKLETADQPVREFYITTVVLLFRIWPCYYLTCYNSNFGLSRHAQDHSEVKIGRSPDQNIVVLKDSECSRSEYSLSLTWRFHQNLVAIVFIWHIPVQVARLNWSFWPRFVH